MIRCFGKRKSALRFDWSKDHCKRRDLLRFVLLLSKRQIIVQVRPLRSSAKAPKLYITQHIVFSCTTHKASMDLSEGEMPHYNTLNTNPSLLRRAESLALGISPRPALTATYGLGSIVLTRVLSVHFCTDFSSLLQARKYSSEHDPLRRRLSVSVRDQMDENYH